MSLNKFVRFKNQNEAKVPCVLYKVVQFRDCFHFSQAAIDFRARCVAWVCMLLIIWTFLAIMRFNKQKRSFIRKHFNHSHSFDGSKCTLSTQGFDMKFYQERSPNEEMWKNNYDKIKIRVHCARCIFRELICHSSTKRGRDSFVPYVILSYNIMVGAPFITAKFNLIFDFRTYFLRSHRCFCSVFCCRFFHLHPLLPHNFPVELFSSYYYCVHNLIWCAKTKSWIRIISQHHRTAFQWIHTHSDRNMPGCVRVWRIRNQTRKINPYPIRSRIDTKFP